MKHKGRVLLKQLRTKTIDLLPVHNPRDAFFEGKCVIFLFGKRLKQFSNNPAYSAISIARERRSKTKKVDRLADLLNLRIGNLMCRNMKQIIHERNEIIVSA